MDDIQEDLDEAAEYAQQLLESRRREQELLARSPALHAELGRIEAETADSCAAIRYALTRIFHGDPF